MADFVVWDCEESNLGIVVPSVKNKELTQEEKEIKRKILAEHEKIVIGIRELLIWGIFIKIGFL